MVVVLMGGGEKKNQIAKLLLLFLRLFSCIPFCAVAPPPAGDGVPGGGSALAPKAWLRLRLRKEGRGLGGKQRTAARDRHVST